MNIIQSLITIGSITQTTNCEQINNISSDMSLLLVILLIAAAWTLFWKALALWYAARNNNKAWFIGLLLINTLGILEMIYLFFVLKIKINKLYNYVTKIKK